MNIDRIWIIGISAAILIVGVLGWLLGISPVVAQAAAADQQRVTISDANQASEDKIAVLKKQFANIGKLQAALDTLGTSVPGESNLALFLREIDSLTNQYHVSLMAVTVSGSQKYLPVVVAAPAVTGTTGTSTPASTPSPSAPAGTTPAPVAAAGPGGRLVVIPVKLTVSGSYDNVMSFVGALQTGDRLYLMSDLVVKASTTAGGADIQANVTGTVFALPSVAGTASAVTATTPSTTPSTTTPPTPTPSSTPTPSAKPVVTPSPAPTP